ncbi:hypothetical protein Dsin_013729 [Dipteronia sinensis]|uniref:Uncharacterized protein n=1 Tax=Dipteronia sinensis TaxID=43782 RepID=A0AAE0E9D7_9ROSI|nr:hypothetical protein Dsin_013729 [Dipteronia sinensis]
MDIDMILGILYPPLVSIPSLVFLSGNQSYYDGRIRIIRLIIAAVLIVLMFCLCWRKYKAKEEKWWLPLIVVVGSVLVIPPLCYSCYEIWRVIRVEVATVQSANAFTSLLKITIKKQRREKHKQKQSFQVCREDIAGQIGLIWELIKVPLIVRLLISCVNICLAM